MKYPDLNIKTFYINELTEEKKEEILNQIYDFSQSNLKQIEKEYLRKRINKFYCITLTHREGTIVGFAFHHFFFMSQAFIKIPVFHLGLCVYAESVRKKGVAVYVSTKVFYKILRDRHLKKRSLALGMLITSKSSSPGSYLSHTRNSKIYIPRITKSGDLGHFSRSRLGRSASRWLSRGVAQVEVSDFTLKGINEDNQFRLKEEEYIAKNDEEQSIINFFENKIFPYNELVIARWYHPWVHYVRHR